MPSFEAKPGILPNVGAASVSCQIESSISVFVRTLNRDSVSYMPYDLTPLPIKIRRIRPRVKYQMKVKSPQVRTIRLVKVLLDGFPHDGFCICGEFFFDASGVVCFDLTVVQSEQPCLFKVHGWHVDGVGNGLHGVEEWEVWGLVGCDLSGDCSGEVE